MTETVTADIGSQKINISSGSLAKQANGSVLVQVGNTVLLTTATMSKTAKEGIDFLPLTVEYTEKMYSAGKIPGGFFKREARPSTAETLTARLVDRPLRPSFPKGFHNDVQVIINVLSYDESVSLENLAILSSSAALSISDIPFNGPIGSALVGYINNEFVLNPTAQDLKKGDLHLVVAGTKEAVLMVEAGANELSEEQLIEAIEIGHQGIKESILLQEKLVNSIGKEKAEVPGQPEKYQDTYSAIESFIQSQITDVFTDSSAKSDIEKNLTQIQESVYNEFISEDEDNQHLVTLAYNAVKKDQIRSLIINKKIRPDGRTPDQIRPISIEINPLPAPHGSAVFTRGETQSLGVVTLGTSIDEMMIDSIAERAKNKYYFHYNFPPFSVGEVGRISTGRRELGHGALAERALKPVLPDLENEFPYTVRIVSEILESNGSSSMASVCSGALALMDCGVPIKNSVSGIAMGLLMDGDNYIVLSDIQGLEDHYGDMDFKVAGTKDGITALQLDIKIAGLSRDILNVSLEQAKKGRLEILEKMNQSIEMPRETLAPTAPRIHVMMINPEKVGALIGPGGKMIRKIEEDTGATVTVSDTNKGEVSIFSENQNKLDHAINMINSITKDPEVGDTFNGKVTKTISFGAFIELVPGKEGLLHISKISDEHVERVEDYLNVGDSINVKIQKIDSQNRINLERVK